MTTINDKILFKLGELEGTMNGVKETLDNHVIVEGKWMVQIDKRIGSLEQFKSRIMGVTIGVSGIVGSAAAYIGYWFKHGGKP